MGFDKANEKLAHIDQRQLLWEFDKLDDAKKKELLRQIDRVDPSLFKLQRALIAKTKRPFSLFSPYRKAFKTGSTNDAQLGRTLLSKGKVGCIIAAGGQGTRLGFFGPKGTFPVSVIKRKTLYQLFVEKVLYASRQAGVELPIAIMTSPYTHRETIAYFEDNNFFSLSSDQVCFFCQETLPLLDERGNLFLESPGKIAIGPDGNGSALHQFVLSGIYDKWKERGIESLSLLFIDNPLADPFDAELFGHHLREANDVTIKCIERTDVNERLGLIVDEESHARIIEYTEFPYEEWEAIDDAGRLRHRHANIGLYILKMAFINHLAIKHPLKRMPLHLAHKKARFLEKNGTVIEPKKPNAWKFEHFIFDILPFAKKTTALTYPREICYAPLKNEIGVHSIETVRQALQAIDYQIFYRISGQVPPSRPFELSLGFHYPTTALLQKWQGHELPNEPYIEV